MKTKSHLKKAGLLFLVLVSFLSFKTSAQVGVLTGWGMASCQQFSFGICPSQTITPILYGSEPYTCNNHSLTPYVAFNINGSTWRINKYNWNFTAVVGGLLSGFDQFGAPQSVSFAAGDVITPSAYTNISGVDYITFAINGSPVSFLLNQGSFSISLNNVLLSAGNFTFCNSTDSSVAISVTPSIAGSFSYNWQPGGLSGNPVSVSPTVNTVYTVTATYAGTCSTMDTVNVTIYCPGSGCCLGNACGTTPNSLNNDYQIPMNNKNFNFTTPALSKGGIVMMGQTNCSSASARLDVNDDVLGTGIYGHSGTASQNNIGIHGSGINGTPNTGLATIGVVGETNGFSKNDQKNKYAGVAGFCGSPNYALMPNSAIGVYGNSVGNNGNWAGYFDGDVNINGSAFCTAMSWSDRRFKKNITPLDNVSDKIAALKGYTYNYRTDEFKNKNFPEAQQIGFIAQELKEVFPQLVVDDKQGYLAVNYVGFIPVLLQAFKEQKQQIDELKALVNAQANTAAAATNGATSIPVTLSDKNAIVLDQNVPNPFAESTVISYNIPSDFTKAQIIFSTGDGVVIKVVAITEKGPGSLSVFANDLSHGLYTYALVVDGKTIDTKKMIKQ